MEYIQKSLFGVLYEEEYIKIRKSNFLVQVAPGRHLHGAPTPGALPPNRASVLWLQASILFFMVLDCASKVFFFISKSFFKPNSHFLMEFQNSRITTPLTSFLNLNNYNMPLTYVGDIIFRKKKPRRKYTVSYTRFTRLLLIVFKRI